MTLKSFSMHARRACSTVPWLNLLGLTLLVPFALVAIYELIVFVIAPLAVVVATNLRMCAIVGALCVGATVLYELYACRHRNNLLARLGRNVRDAFEEPLPLLVSTAFGGIIVVSLYGYCTVMTFAPYVTQYGLRSLLLRIAIPWSVGYVCFMSLVFYRHIRQSMMREQAEELKRAAQIQRDAEAAERDAQAEAERIEQVRADEVRRATILQQAELFFDLVLGPDNLLSSPRHALHPDMATIYRAVFLAQLRIYAEQLMITEAECAEVSRETSNALDAKTAELSAFTPGTYPSVSPSDDIVALLTEAASRREMAFNAYCQAREVANVLIPNLVARRLGNGLENALADAAAMRMQIRPAREVARAAIHVATSQAEMASTAA